MKISICNLAKYQHYHDGRPMHWVKLHRKILDDPQYAQLSDSAWRLGQELVMLAFDFPDQIIETTIEDLSWRLHRKIRSKDLSSLEDAGFISTVRTEPRTNPYESVPRVEKSREEKNTCPPVRPVREDLDGFNEAWLAYVRSPGNVKGRSSKTEAAAMWKKLKLNGNAKNVIAWIHDARTWPDWQVGQNGKSCQPAMHRWLRQHADKFGGLP